MYRAVDLPAGAVNYGSGQEQQTLYPIATQSNSNGRIQLWFDVEVSLNNNAKPYIQINNPSGTKYVMDSSSNPTVQQSDGQWYIELDFSTTDPNTYTGQGGNYGLYIPTGYLTYSTPGNSNTSEDIIQDQTLGDLRQLRVE